MSAFRGHHHRCLWARPLDQLLPQWRSCACTQRHATSCNHSEPGREAIDKDLAGFEGGVGPILTCQPDAARPGPYRFPGAGSSFLRCKTHIHEVLRCWSEAVLKISDFLVGTSPGMPEYGGLWQWMTYQHTRDTHDASGSASMKQG